MGPQEEKIVAEADSATSPIAPEKSAVLVPDDKKKKQEVRTTIAVDTSLQDEGHDDGVDGGGDGKSASDLVEEKVVSNSTEEENWYEVLKSPSDDATFSPSLQLVKGSNHLHGIGLKLATERSKKIDIFGRHLAQFVLDISSHYETYGRSVLQTAQLIQPSENFALPAPNDDKSGQFWDAINAYGISFRRTAGFYKSKLYKPYVATLQNDRQTINASNQRYIEIRNDCYGKRVHALKAREMYIQAVKDAEKAVLLWVVAKKNGPESTENISNSGEGKNGTEGKTGNSNDDGNTWECTLNRVGSNIPTATKRLIEYLKNVQNCERSYVKLVEEENKAVTRAQEIELEALRSFQEVEVARIKSLLSDVAKPLCDIKSHSVQRVQLTPHNNDVVSTSSSMDDEFNALASEIEKKGKDLIANLFNKQQQNVPYEEGMGVMDAETLGLSKELGELRDKIKSNITAGENASKAFQILGKFLEEISAATALLAKGLNQAKRTMATSMSSPSNKGSSATESLQSIPMNDVGSRTAQLMKEILEFFYEEAKLYLRLAEFFKSELNGKLETRLHPAAATGNEYKLESETDDRNWKKLCDAARAEARAESNYRKTQQQQEKARGRIHSTGDGGITEGRERISSTEDNPLTRKSLFGGEGVKLQDFGTGKAMKKLQESGRQFLAQKNLNEAGQRIDKEKQIYEAAISSKSKGSTEYRVVTEVRLEKLEKMNEDGWTEIAELLGSILKQIETVQQSREKVPENPLSLDDKTYDGLVKEARDWVESTRRSIQERIDVEGEKKKRSPVDGFQLKVKLDSAEGIYQILSLKGTEDRVAALEIDVPDNETIAQLDASAVECSPAVEGAKRVLSKSASSPMKQDGGQDDQTRSIHSAQITPTRVATRGGQSKPDEMPDLLAFAKEFGFNKNKGFPDILGSMNCTYRKEKASFLVPPLHGRLYTTTDKLYFRAWDGKNLVLCWKNIVSIQKAKGLMGSNDIDVTYNDNDNDNDNQSSFVLGRLEAPENALVHLSDLLQKSKSSNVEPQRNVEVGELKKPVPPDEVIKEMEVVLTRTIRNTSIQRYYEQVWSEGNGTSAEPFYLNWLKEEGCFECEVSDWEKPADSKGFIDPWCQERFPQKRLATFKFKRTSHLYIGPPIAFVKQLQHCRVEGNDKCVLSISASFEGIPYSDCFVVEMRWVARRKGSNDILIEVGLFVDFKKSTMLKSQIKAGTISETKNVHQRLFEAASKTCKAPGDVVEEDSTEVDEDVSTEEQNTEKDAAASTDVFWGMLSSVSTDNNKYMILGAAVLALPLAWRFLSFLFGGGQTATGLHSDEIALLNDRIDGLQAEVKSLKESIDSLASLIKEAQ